MCEAEASTVQNLPPSEYEQTYYRQNDSRQQPPRRELALD